MRNLLLTGKITLPSYDKFKLAYGEDMANLAKSMLTALWRNYLTGKGEISGPYWLEKFQDVKAFNGILKVLSDNKWVVALSSSAAKFSIIKLNDKKLLEFVSDVELVEIKRQFKYLKYVLDFEEDESTVDVVITNGIAKNTGLVREGMAKSASTQFSFDSTFADDHYDAIVRNVTKGMAKIREAYPNMSYHSSDYDAVSAEIVHMLLAETNVYNMGFNYIDSRGRAIKSSLAKVGNPIGFKDFRSMMSIPPEFRVKATAEGLKAVFLFIAELNSFKKGTYDKKLEFGQECYLNDTLPELSDSTVYEIIWLKRLYKEVHEYHNNLMANTLATDLGLPEVDYKWSVPIELDCSASILQIEGALLGDKRLLSMTNLIETPVLSDPWYIPGIPRKQLKVALTPILYGSSKDPASLWRSKNIKFTMEQVQLVNKELTTGAFGVVNSFKDFIIKWVDTMPEMQVNIMDEEFTITCNRHKAVMDTVVAYQIYDTTTDTYPVIYNVKQQVTPDLTAFKRYFPTLLAHNIDSQVMDKLVGSVISTHGWALDIHDAVIISPEAAADVRQWYGEYMKTIYENRKDILNNFFASIGITQVAAKEWQDLMGKVVPLDGEFVPNPMAMK